MKQRMPAMGTDEAETIALEALAYLAGDDAQLGRFLSLSGLDAAGLRAEAGSPALNAAVLDYVMRDEGLLLVLAAHRNRDPAEIAAAHRLLSGDAIW